MQTLPQTHLQRAAQKQHRQQQHLTSSRPKAARWQAHSAAAVHKVACRAVADASPAAAQGARDMSESLKLDNVRSALIRQEDSIIFSLIERAQFALNPVVYQPDGVQVPAFGKDGKRYSLLEYMLRETEQLHGKIRRFTSPDEHAFYAEDLPVLVLPPLEYDGVLAPAAKGININNRIMQLYLNKILPAIAAAGDDGNYGSAATLDVATLQALSKRIHYGKFVAEAKFRARPEEYTELIKAGDAAGLMELLTDVVVEQNVVERVRLKAATFGRDIGGAESSSDESKLKIRPEVLATMYDKMVMPLTKDVQVEYLLHRLDHV